MLPCFVFQVFCSGDIFFSLFLLSKRCEGGGEGGNMGARGSSSEKKNMGTPKKKKKKKNYENRLTWLSCEGEHHFSLASS